jgi:MFS family permease
VRSPGGARPSSGADERRASAVATLREPTFRYYFLSRLVNAAGSTMGGIALAFAVLEVSGSPTALGIVLAARSIPEVLLLLAGGVIADRFGRTLVQLQRPLLWGMAGCTFFGVPMVVLGAEPNLALVVVAAFVGGAGIEVFSLGWNLAMQEHVPDDMLSRAYSYDALGSFAAIPLGQLAVGPLGAVFGVRETIFVCGVLFVVISVATLGSRSVRELQRAPVTPTSRPEP